MIEPVYKDLVSKVMQHRDKQRVARQAERDALYELAVALAKAGEYSALTVRGEFITYVLRQS